LSNHGLKFGQKTKLKKKKDDLDSDDEKPVRRRSGGFDVELNTKNFGEEEEPSKE